jgi:hypothetical protein
MVVARLGQKRIQCCVRGPLSRPSGEPGGSHSRYDAEYRVFDGVQLSRSTHLFIGTQFTPVDTAYGPPGVYFTTSPDFVHWSKSGLALTMNQMLRRDPAGNWSYAYFSLIDPKSTDSNFMTIIDTPYLYYVRSDVDHGPYQRVLARQKIKLNWLTKGQNR